MAKTEKQAVGGGYHRPVCPECECELRPERNGWGVLDMADFGPCALYDADLWKCPKCGKKVIGGFGLGPMARHSDEGFARMVKTREDAGILTRNFG